MRRTTRMLTAACACVALAGCASDAPIPEGALVADPYEETNRQLHDFNRGWDQILLRPASQVYDFATPELVKFLVGNFFDHLKLPVVFANNVLQGDFESAGSTAARFVTNTVLGAAGLLDPATEFGLPYEPTDAGLTLASYDVDEGAYIVLPFFGPSTTRDAVGRVFDFAIDPFNFLSVPGGDAAAAARIALPIVDERAANAPLIDDVLYNAPDSYVTARSFYIQNRRRRIQGPEVAPDALPDIFGDEAEASSP